MMERNSKADALVIDLDGVLRHWPDDASAVESRYQLPIGSIASVAFDKAMLGPAIRGEIQDEHWRNQVAKELLGRYPDADVQSAVSDWSQPCGEIDHRVLELVAACRTKATVALGTNATSRLSSDLAFLGIAQHFDLIVNSSDVGHAKPESAYYLRILDATGTNAGRTVFIDDTLRNVEAASAHGFLAHLYSGVDQLRVALSRHGLVSG